MIFYVIIKINITVMKTYSFDLKSLGTELLSCLKDRCVNWTQLCLNNSHN